MPSAAQQQLRDWLVNKRFAAIIQFAARNRRTLSFLTALTYDSDDLVAWRAVEALGLAAARLADDDPEYVRIHLRRLLWLLNDESGGIGWRAPEAIGEIIRNRPNLFGEFIPLLISILDLEQEDAPRFRAGTLWAIGRLGQVIPKELNAANSWIETCLQDPDPQTRGMAIWCLLQIHHTEPILHHASLLEDSTPVQLYTDSLLCQTTVKQLALQALAGEH
jgi:hypothetical protein